MNILSKYYKHISILPEKDFLLILNQLIETKTNKNLVKELLYNSNSNYHLNYNDKIALSSHFTNKYLKRIRFSLA